MSSLSIRQLMLTTNEVQVEHLLIEYSDDSVVCMRRDQADILFDTARLHPKKV